MTMWATSSYFTSDDTGSFHFQTSPTLKEVIRRAGGEKEIEMWKVGKSRNFLPPPFHTTPVRVRCTGDSSDPAPRCSLVGDFSAFTGLNAKGVKWSYFGLTHAPPPPREGEETLQVSGEYSPGGIYPRLAWQDLSPEVGEGSPNTPQTSPWLEPADWICFSNTGRILSCLGGSCYPDGCKN